MRTPYLQSFARPKFGAPKSSLLFEHGEHAGRAYANNMSDAHLLWEAAGPPSRRQHGRPPPKQRQLEDWRRQKAQDQEREAISHRLAVRLEDKERTSITTEGDGAGELLMLTQQQQAQAQAQAQQQTQQRLALVGPDGAPESTRSNLQSTRSTRDKQLPQPEVTSRSHKKRVMPGALPGALPGAGAAGGAGSNTQLVLLNADGSEALNEAEQADAASRNSLALVVAEALESALHAFNTFRTGTSKKWMGAGKEVNSLPPPRKCGFTPSSLASADEIHLRESHDALHMHRGGDKALARTSEGRQSERAMRVAPSCSIAPKDRPQRAGGGGTARESFRQKSTKQIKLVQQQKEQQLLLLEGGGGAGGGGGASAGGASAAEAEGTILTAPSTALVAAADAAVAATAAANAVADTPLTTAAASAPSCAPAAPTTAPGTSAAPGPEAPPAPGADSAPAPPATSLTVAPGALPGMEIPRARKERKQRSALDAGYVRTLPEHERAHKSAVRKAYLDAASSVIAKQEAGTGEVKGMPTGEFKSRKELSDALIRAEAAREASARRPSDGVSASPLHLNGIKVRQVGRDTGATRNDRAMAPGWQEKQLERGVSPWIVSDRRYGANAFDAPEKIMEHQMQSPASMSSGTPTSTALMAAPTSDDPPPRPWVRNADGFGRDNLWAKPWGRLYTAPPYRTDEKECRTRVAIDYGNGFISIERPDWTAAQLPEPWVHEPPRTGNDLTPWT